MSSTRSDTSENTATSHKTDVREFLRTHEEVASKDQVCAGTEVPAWYIVQIASKFLLHLAQLSWQICRQQARSSSPINPRRLLPT